MPRIKQLKAALMDTHVWIWAAAGESRASALSAFAGVAYVSAISVWEVGMLARKGRVHLRPTVEEWVEHNLQSPVELEPITPTVALLSSTLENFHGDPADRMIVATAIVCGVPLFTADQGITAWAKTTGQLQVLHPEKPE
jgi:PIN domain nuclease of toxin-antitoxin system